MTTTYEQVLAWKARTQNGEIPLFEMEIVQPEMYDPDLGMPARMWTPAARAMSAMLAAAQDDGHSIVVLYSYRTLAKQWEKWRKFGSPRAAEPGTSNHGDALSVDLTSLDYYDSVWLRDEAGRYGFRNDVYYESWHWTYYGSRDFAPGAWEEDMTLEQYHEGQTRYQNRYKDLREKHPHEDPDPGVPPDEWTQHIKWGWNDARFAGQNPKGN